MKDEKGRFVKGNEGKPKGAENKVTQEARELFLQTLEGQVPNINQAFEDVRGKNPALFLDLFQKYAQYFIPKKTQSEVNTNVTLNDFNIKDVIQFDNLKP